MPCDLVMDITGMVAVALSDKLLDEGTQGPVDHPKTAGLLLGGRHNPTLLMNVEDIVGAEPYPARPAARVSSVPNGEMWVSLDVLGFEISIVSDQTDTFQVGKLSTYVGPLNDKKDPGWDDLGYAVDLRWLDRRARLDRDPLGPDIVSRAGARLILDRGLLASRPPRSDANVRLEFDFPSRGVTQQVADGFRLRWTSRDKSDSIRLRLAMLTVDGDTKGEQQITLRPADASSNTIYLGLQSLCTWRRPLTAAVLDTDEYEILLPAGCRIGRVKGTPRTGFGRSDGRPECPSSIAAYRFRS